MRQGEWAIAKIRALRQSAVIMTWYARLAGIISLVLVLPVVIKSFPSHEVALYMFYGTFVRFINIADLGFTLTYTRFVSYAMGGVRGFDEHELNAVQGEGAKSPNIGLLLQVQESMRNTYNYIALAFLVLFGGAATVQLHTLQGESGSLLGLWAAFLLVTALRVRYKYLSAQLSGMGFVHRLREIEGTYSLVQSLLLFVVAFWFQNIHALLGLLVLWQLLLTVRDYILFQKMALPMMGVQQEQDPTPKIDIWKKVMPLSLKGGLGNLISVGFYQSVGFIFAGSLPAGQLVQYLFVTRFLEQTKDLSMAPFYAKIPRFGTLFVRDREQLIRESGQAMQRSLGVFALGIAVFAVFDYAFIDWMGKELADLNPRLWLLLFGAFFAERFGSMLVQMYNLTNQVRYHTINLGVTTLILMIMYVLGFHDATSYGASAMGVFHLVFVPWSLYHFQQKYEIRRFMGTFLLYFGVLIALGGLWALTSG
jgi:hypothetical protein